MHRPGNASVRLERRVLVSPVARTDRHTSMYAGTGDIAAARPSRCTCFQRNARSSSVRAPVNSETTIYGCNRSPAVLINTSSACCAVSAFEGRPRRPVGSSVTSTTFRRTRSRAMARFTARFRHDRIACSVRVHNVVESSSARHPPESPSGRAASGRLTVGSRALAEAPLTSWVAESRLLSPYVSQPSTA